MRLSVQRGMRRRRHVRIDVHRRPVIDRGGRTRHGRWMRIIHRDRVIERVSL